MSNKICGICLEEAIIPCLSIHDEKSQSVCRQIFCEGCLDRVDFCPMCRGKKKSYMICAWLMDFEKEIECPNCEWNGTTIMYYCVHSQVCQ